MSAVAEVVPGADLAPRFEEVLADGQTDLVHLRNAGAGCFAARIDR